MRQSFFLYITVWIFLLAWFTFKPFANWVFDRPSRERLTRPVGALLTLRIRSKVFLCLYSLCTTRYTLSIKLFANKMSVFGEPNQRGGKNCEATHQYVIKSPICINVLRSIRGFCAVFCIPFIYLWWMLVYRFSSHCIRCIRRETAGNLCILIVSDFFCSQEVLEARILELEDSLQRLQKSVTQQQQQVSCSAYICSHIASRNRQCICDGNRKRGRGAPLHAQLCNLIAEVEHVNILYFI